VKDADEVLAPIAATDDGDPACGWRGQGGAGGAERGGQLFHGANPGSRSQTVRRRSLGPGGPRNPLATIQMPRAGSRAPTRVHLNWMRRGRSYSREVTRNLHWPRRGRTNQPRATPWGKGSAETMQALKGRNRPPPAGCCALSGLAMILGHLLTQGV